MEKRISKISDTSMENLIRYPWPGNIRELQNVIERAVILTKDDVLVLPSLPSRAGVRSEAGTLKEAEREHIMRALEESNWVVAGRSGAAARLGMARTTLLSKMQARGISRGMSQSRCAL
jgi:formate hydrogenlyase transcriptional activator